MEVHRIDGSVQPGDPLADQVRSLFTSTQPSLPASRAARARAVLAHPTKVATGLWLAGAVAALSSSFTGNWSEDDRAILMAIAGTCLVGGCVNLFFGDRMPHWGYHVGVVASIVLMTVGAAIGPNGQVDFAILYIWVIVYAALYFSPAVSLSYIAAIGATYAALLGLGPVVGNPVAAWLTVVGTGVVIGVVVLLLVWVMRLDAREDPVTGLANRRSWDERLEEEIERSRRSGAPFSVAMIDLDDFKAVNDREGHEVGNLLLRNISAAWQGLIRGGGDFLARLGGDEFGLLLPGSDGTGVRRFIMRMAEVTPEGVGYSIGLATWDGEETAGDLLRRADFEMYREKLSHRQGTDRPSPPPTRGLRDTKDCRHPLRASAPFRSDEDPEP